MRRGRPRTRGTLGGHQRTMERSWPIWSHYCTVLKADPAKRGRVGRAEQSCADRFEVDLTTVQRAIRAMKPIVEHFESSERAFAEAGNSLRAIQGQIADALAEGLITPGIAWGMKHMSVADATLLLRRLRAKSGK